LITILESSSNQRTSKTRLTREDLSHSDAKEGRPTYFESPGKVSHVGSSKLWKDGGHLRKHAAGSDLTGILHTAPHGEEKIFY